LAVVFGCGLYEKKLAECLHIVGQQADRIALVVSSHFKSASVAVLRQHLAQKDEQESDATHHHHKELAVESESDKPSVAEGIKAALSLSSSAGEQWAVIVCGSLFVAADGRLFLASLLPFPPQDWLHYADPQLFVYK
jgi:folylpolyglutamate synthase/dihydropteroate synthase